MSTHPLDPTQPAKPTRTNPLVIDPKNQLQQFSPLKLASTDPTRKLIKIWQSKLFLVSFCQNTSNPTRFMPDLGRSHQSSEISSKSCGNLTGSSEILPYPVRSSPDLARFFLNCTILAGFFCR